MGHCGHNETSGDEHFHQTDQKSTASIYRKTEINRYTYTHTHHKKIQTTGVKKILSTVARCSRVVRSRGDHERLGGEKLHSTNGSIVSVPQNCSKSASVKVPHGNVTKRTG